VFLHYFAVVSGSDVSES